MNYMDKYAGLEFEVVVLKYSDHIARICVLHTGNTEDAKDCFQNTFLKLYITEKVFEDEEHLKAWLLRVAMNECRDYHRSLWKRKVKLGLSAEEKESWSGKEEIVCSEECMDVMEKLQAIPQKYRQVLYLYYFEEYDTKEIAEILEVSINTVKSRLKRGREKLQVEI